MLPYTYENELQAPMYSPVQFVSSHRAQVAGTFQFLEAFYLQN